MPVTTPQFRPQKKSNVPRILVIIAVVFVLLGGFMYLYKLVTTAPPKPPAPAAPDPYVRPVINSQADFIRAIENEPLTPEYQATKRAFFERAEAQRTSYLAEQAAAKATPASLKKKKKSKTPTKSPAKAPVKTPTQ